MSNGLQFSHILGFVFFKSHQRLWGLSQVTVTATRIFHDFF